MDNSKRLASTEQFYFAKSEAVNAGCSPDFLGLWNWCDHHQVYFFGDCPICRETAPDELEPGEIEIDDDEL